MINSITVFRADGEKSQSETTSHLANLAEPIIFILPLIRAVAQRLEPAVPAGRCDAKDNPLPAETKVTVPECRYLDTTTNTFKTNGCVKTGQDATSVTCSCNHTTDFALLLRDLQTYPCTGRPAEERAAFASFGAVYTIVMIGAVLQLTRIGECLFIFMLRVRVFECSTNSIRFHDRLLQHEEEARWQVHSQHAGHSAYRHLHCCPASTCPSVPPYGFR